MNSSDGQGRCLSIRHLCDGGTAVDWRCSHIVIWSDEWSLIAMLPERRMSLLAIHFNAVACLFAHRQIATQIGLAPMAKLVAAS